MGDTPKGLRRHIAIVGRRNAGKSTFMNALSGQNVSIVSPQPGTTTDTVEKTMELKPLGPVVLMDTAGADDVGALGEERNRRARAALRRADVALLLTDGAGWGAAEGQLQSELKAADVPYVIVRHKADIPLLEQEQWRAAHHIDAHIRIVDASAAYGIGLDDAVHAVEDILGREGEASLIGHLLPPGAVVLLVIPLDSGAPRGRLILPQVQTIRDGLDHGQMCCAVAPGQLTAALSRFQPDLVVCDSQVARETFRLTPPQVPVTTFSILMAQCKGDLRAFAAGARALTQLEPGDTVLIQEACSHHAQGEDIGRVKIPGLLNAMARGKLNFRFAQGKELTEYEENIHVIVHCGGCVITPKQMRLRQQLARRHAVPMTNYGTAICCAQGLLGRALELFPEALDAFQGGEGGRDPV